MAKGFKHGTGGGTSLNFKVVGNPQPENPKENTIWIDTDTPVDGWMLGAAQPENPTEGMVWISTGTSSSVPFNALKKNGITVYPLSAKQYVGGAWVDKTAQIYKSGVWVDFVTYLFANGDECKQITGGWYIAINTSPNNATYSNSNGHLNLKLTISYNITASTKNTIDLTDVDTIVVKATTVTGSYVALKVKNDASGGTSATLVSANIAPGENKIDVSQITGSYYVAFEVSAGELSVSEVHLE